MKYYIFLSILFFKTAIATATTTDSSKIQYYYLKNGFILGYQKPRPMQFLKNIPYNFVDCIKKNSNPAGAIALTSVAISTLLLIPADQDIINSSQQFGRFLNLDRKSSFKNISPFKFAEISIPKNTNSWFYYFGDGLAHTPITASFLLYGLLKKDNRALQTGLQLMEGYLVMGTLTQLIKHSTGRESPFRASKPGGRWHFFPNQKDYHNSVPTYDAFPSGHLATIMVALTVISENYPDKLFIKPLGYSILSLCAYSMLNNGVHWASDYPLSLAMGYFYGKYLVNRYRTTQKQKNLSLKMTKTRNKIHFYPAFYPAGLGFSFRYSIY